MKKKLIKYGNSSALIIDKPILELLDITPETPLKITTDGEVLIIVPIREDRDTDEFEEIVDRTIERYAPALEKMAE